MQSIKRNLGISLLLLVIFGFMSSFNSTKKAGEIPPFKMLQTNGRYFTAMDIPREKPIVIIYFAPDCEHCQVLMNELFKKMPAFKNTELVLVTFKSIEEVADFEKAYGTRKYDNIHVGTEGNTFFLRMYYKIQNTPFTILYDKNGKAICSYRAKTPVDDLISHINQLK